MRVLLVAAASALAAAQSATISVDWATTIRPLKTQTAFQTVVNPVTCRESPYHDAVYQKIADLKAPYQRYVPWLPYPRLGIAELERPSRGGLCGFVNSGGPRASGGMWNTTLDCGRRGLGTIDSVVFANYGHPTGYCNSLKATPACSKDVSATVAAACVGKASCTLTSNDETFGAAPCADARLAVEVTCSANHSALFTYWDFAKPDEGMIDFLTAANSSGRTAIPNFSTIPNWLFVNADRSYFPDDPLGETWGYETGKDFADDTLQDLGDYYGRLVAHYVEGGFVDEAGDFVPGHRFTISTWEVLNEIEGEHGLSPQLYTRVYDAIVGGIRRWAPTGSANMQFMALALEDSGNVGYVEYFLNASNHVPTDTRIDFVSFHHYAGAARDGGVNGSAYEGFFPSGDGWLKQVSAIMAARDALNPTVMLDADEVGVILSDDNDPQWTADAPGFPAIYWNAAAAMYAYLFGTTAALGLDVLGESQLIGYPSIPFARGLPYNGSWIAPPQFPSVTLLSWGGAFGQPGDGTARYWALKLLVDEFTAGPPAGTAPAAAADILVHTSVSGGGSAPSSPFCGSVINLQDLTLACDTGVISGIAFASYGTPSGACGSWAVNASCNSANSTSVVSALCLGKQTCTVTAGPPNFDDPCYGTVKYLDVQATCSTGGGGQVLPASVFAQAFTEAAGARKLLVVNKLSTAQTVTLPGAAGASWTYIDESTAFGPAVKTTIAADSWTLAPFALGVLRLAA